MLDAETKRKIDNARDILVGKVPDPKSQVEQITIALIYKFMDDMDRESEELGGKASFFTGEYKKYSWSKIFDPKLGGFDLITLYGEAIAKMNTNKNIPQLFRDIFKNAFLPYRDPETLKSFLKEINDFRYDHSERLGDAFEYLLSVLGSQGEAGQFRTPRHIIDFIVAVVDPKKGETVLDPAGGTAGFLISSYKHILKANTSPEALKSGMNGSFAGDLLTPDDRKRIMDSFEGYDISPDMVRLSLVNMYLHGFPSPRIHEYDTLTSEDRWGESFDVILANPPFMTPKGGIRPHKRFSIQANRSEVLFVDYIAEHIATTGRAGVIVPEGIIFQSANAYKSLRKMLIEQNYLWAVVSLPAGVFNPYSGVKTSILFMDKALAKKTNDILFIKIEHDGFDLGAQRRPNGKDDLPDALDVLRKYKKSLSLPVSIDGVNALIVSKSRIAENGEYNFSVDRYRDTIIHSHRNWPMVKLGEVCSLEYGKPLKEDNRIQGNYPVFGSNGIVGYHNSFLVESPFIVVGRKGSAGSVHYSEKNGFPIDTTFYVKFQNENSVLTKYMYYILKTLGLDKVNTQAGVPGLNRNDAYSLKIPLPPLEIQKEIVAVIEGYQKIIDGARQVVENWKPSFTVDPEWPLVELSRVCEINPKKSEIKDIPNDLIVSFVPMEDLNENQMYFSPQKERSLGELIKSYTYFRNDDVLLARVTPCFENGKGGIAKGLSNGIGFGSSEFFVIRSLGSIIPEFIYCLISNQRFKEHGKNMMTGTGGLQRVPVDYLCNYKIPLPSLDIQKSIVERIEEEQKLVDSNKRLIEIYEAKIKSKINEVWGN